MRDKYDFSGWATKNDLLCSDGRTIRKGAFEAQDGEIVPLVWNHKHNDLSEVLGHALLENRAEGVYTYGTFNDTDAGQRAKELVRHGDVTSLSIFANQLKQQRGDVLHGVIREVSLVLAGANPGATIENVVVHGLYDDEEDDNTSAVIKTGDKIELAHNDETASDETVQDANHIEHKEEAMADKETKGKDAKDKTVKEVLDELTEEQQMVVYALIGAALDENKPEGEKENDMKHNLFDQDETENNALSHAELTAILDDAKRYGSLKDAVIQHGITDIDYLFPDAQNVDNIPPFITRNMDWVSKVMNDVHKSPFSRIKSIFANLTADEARAKGYQKGNLKIEQVFTLLKRTTTPATIYKKQKLDRDDVIDITSFDVVAWIKTEMRMMLNEEIARAILVGDGRDASSDDKISELNIRPIWTDADLYTIKVATEYTDEETNAKNFIKNAVKARKNYKGSGNPSLFATEDIVTSCLLLEDGYGRRLYKDINELATAMRVKDIITVPVLENLTRTEDDLTYTLDGIIANLKDYNVGADKGGAVSMFEDFDIDYNAQKYLIETRCSGALVVPYSAIVLEHTEAAG